MRQLEQSLPFILWKERLFEGRAAGVLGLALLLPVVDLGLLTTESALVVLKVVGLGVVCLDAIEEKVAVLLEERVNAKQEVVEVRGKNRGFRRWAGLEGSQRWRKVKWRRLLLGSLKLVNE